MTFARIVFSFVIFTVALVAGFKAGEEFDSLINLIVHPINETAMPGVPIPDNQQFNLLIIGADDSNKTDPQLESIWLLAHANDTSKVTLIPIFPSIKDPVQNLILAEAFDLKDGEPSNAFWDAMRNTNLWWNSYIVSDMFETINMIDLIGGIQVHDRVLNGAQAVSSIPPWESNPQTAIKYQMLILAGICNQISENQVVNLKVASEIIFTDFRSIMMTTETFTNLTVQSEIHKKLTCSFPTLEQAAHPTTLASP